MKNRKIFAGAKLRTIREREKLTQGQMAARLDVSTSYINQIENNQRPLTASVMLGLSEKFNLDLSELLSANTDRLLADLHEALADPVFSGAHPSLMELKSITANAPGFAHSLLTLYQAYRKTSEQLAGADEAMSTGASGPVLTPYEEVRDFFHYADNYIDPLDRAAEELAGEIHGTPAPADTGGQRLLQLEKYLLETHDIRIGTLGTRKANILRQFDKPARTLLLNPHLPAPSRFFQIAHQLALLEQTTTIARIVKEAGFKTPEARQICRIGLANYFAGALQMPYSPFLSSAKALAYDLEELARTFSASLEQVAHRLSSMQRDKQRGIPFFFARVDAAGTITKRHSATPLQFARFGGACPLWNVHRAFETKSEIIRQFAQTPDGNRYLCLAWSQRKTIGGYGSPARTYAYALGCEISHAGETVYASEADLAPDRTFDPIGISCRTCSRRDCVQRSVPPIAASISVTENQRTIVPYQIE